ncbi:MAG: hypothetical protein NC548_31960, partial [Lachnospiraceae bacterium]|nr:hypothetical protein [Lachnospiraceae bacterium]
LALIRLPPIYVERRGLLMNHREISVIVNGILQNPSTSAELRDQLLSFNEAQLAEYARLVKAMTT